MKITIPRCYKKPGFIVRAKIYYIELNDKGLYLVALGNASAMPRTHGMIQQYAAEKAVAFFDAKYEPEIQGNEQRIRNGELDSVVTGKHSYFVAKNDVSRFTIEPHFGALRVKIKGGKANLDLQVSAQHENEIREMQRVLTT